MPIRRVSVCEIRSRGRATSATAVLTGVVACLAYAATLYPSVAGGDSGELVAAAATLGVPHPPGYPLYVLLTAPFTWMPWLSVAGRANLAAAVFGAAAAAMVCRAAMLATGRWWAGVAAGGMFAFSPTVWLYATSAEVFALNNLLIAVQVALLAAVLRQPRARSVYAAAFVLGLGAANHHTSIVFNGILVAAMLYRTRAAWRTPRRLAILGACLAAGLAPYVYLPLAAAREPMIAWGDTGTIDGFAAHLLRRDYGTFQLGSGPAAAPMPLAEQLLFYARDLVRQVSWIGLGLAAWGLARGLAGRDTRFLAAATLAAYATYLIVFHSLANLPLDQPLLHGVVARFWQAPNLLVCVWIGLGLAAIPVVPARGLAIGALALAAAQAARHARDADHHGDFILRDYGAAIVQNAPRDALILTRGDLVTNTSRYVHLLEGVRPDVRVVDIEMLTKRWMTGQVRRHMPDVILPGTHYGVTEPGAYVLRQVVDANIARRPVVHCGGAKPGDTSLDETYRRWPLGLCDRLVPAGRAVDLAQWSAEHEAALPVFRNDMTRVPTPDSWERVAWTDYWEARHRGPLMHLSLAIERRDDPVLLKNAAAGFERVIATHPRPAAYYYKNLGIARARLARTEPSSAMLAVQAFETYLRLAPASEPDLAQIRQAVQELAPRR